MDCQGEDHEGLAIELATEPVILLKADSFCDPLRPPIGFGDGDAKALCSEFLNPEINRASEDMPSQTLSGQVGPKSSARIQAFLIILPPGTLPS